MPRIPTGLRYPKSSTQIRFSLNPAFLPGAKGQARKVVKRVAFEVKKQAKANVAPGVGPGPHPHVSGHTDTGDLMRDIFYRSWIEGVLIGMRIGTTIDYGLFLELGWHTKSGSFYRYPWLAPALQKVGPESYQIGIVENKL